MQAIYREAASIPLNHLSVMGGALLVVVAFMLFYKFRPPKKFKEKDGEKMDETCLEGEC